MFVWYEESDTLDYDNMLKEDFHVFDYNWNILDDLYKFSSFHNEYHLLLIDFKHGCRIDKDGRNINISLEGTKNL